MPISSRSHLGARPLGAAFSAEARVAAARADPFAGADRRPPAHDAASPSCDRANEATTRPPAHDAAWPSLPQNVPILSGIATPHHDNSVPTPVVELCKPKGQVAGTREASHREWLM
ncbi:unnamed protein product, partial [Mesorhabditis spiculigera]